MKWLRAPVLLYRHNVSPYHQITDHSLVLLCGYNHSSKLSIALAWRHQHQIPLLFFFNVSLWIYCTSISSTSSPCENSWSMSTWSSARIPGKMYCSSWSLGREWANLGHFKTVMQPYCCEPFRLSCSPIAVSHSSHFCCLCFLATIVLICNVSPKVWRVALTLKQSSQMHPSVTASSLWAGCLLWTDVHTI